MSDVVVEGAREDKQAVAGRKERTDHTLTLCVTTGSVSDLRHGDMTRLMVCPESIRSIVRNLFVVV